MTMTMASSSPGRANMKSTTRIVTMSTIAAQVAGRRCPTRAGDDQATERDHGRPDQGRARPGHQPGQDIAAQLVCPQPVPGTRAGCLG